MSQNVPNNNFNCMNNYYIIKDNNPFIFKRDHDQSGIFVICKW